MKVTIEIKEITKISYRAYLIDEYPETGVYLVTDENGNKLYVFANKLYKFVYYMGTEVEWSDFLKLKKKKSK